MPTETQDGVADLLHRWQLFVDKQDTKVSFSFLDDYIRKTLSLYRDLSNIEVADQSYHNYTLSNLAIPFKILRAARELEAGLNPLLVKFIVSNIDELGVFL